MKNLLRVDEMKNCKSISTPYDLEISDEEVRKETVLVNEAYEQYPSLVGS